MLSNDSTSEGIQLRPVTLAFEKDQAYLEPLYADHFFTKNLGHLRRCHYVSIIFYLMAGVIDFAIFPQWVLLFWTIRFGCVAPCFLVGLVFTYRPGYRRYWKQISFTYILITGISFLAMMVLAPPPECYTYYIGVAICLMFGYTYIREPFVWAGVAGCTLLFLYFIVSIAIDMPTSTLWLYGFYLTVVNVLGMLIARAFEIQSREDFLKAHSLELEKVKVNQLASGLEQKVRLRTNDLLSANLELKHEITERRSAEQALRVSEQNYRSLQANIPIGLYRIVEGDVISANPAMVEIFRATDPAELLSRPVDDYFHDPDDREKILSDLRNQGTLVNTEIQLKRSDGEPFWTVINVVRSYSENNSVYCYDGTIEDVTDRKAMEAEKVKLERRLRQAHKMESLGTLAGGVAHDFNNILASVIGYTELLLVDAQKESQLEQNLFEIKRAGDRAKDLVQQILTFARQAEETISPVYVSVVAEEVIRFIRSSLPTTIEIKSQLDSQAPIMGNATQIHQILMNLCTNAAQAMKNHTGVLEIATRDVKRSATQLTPGGSLIDQSYVEISVSDTGLGIPSEIQSTIFEPYFTTKRKGEGTGMGLAVVHGIVESYGGQIHVSSLIDQGTVFTICLPATGLKDDAKTMVQSDIPLGTEHIMVVDDEPPIADLMGQLLEYLGYKATIYSSSIDALEDFRSMPERYDLVITDLTMPEMTGKKLTKELLNIRDDLPIILCSGYSNEIVPGEVRTIGVKEFLIKPVHRDKLATAVRQVLDDAKGSLGDIGLHQSGRL